MILPLRIELAITLTFGPRNLAPGVAIKRACKTGLAISARPYRFWRQRPVELGSGRLCFPAEAPLDLARVATVLEPGPICRAARPRVSSFVRRWFDAKGFIEVQPSALQASPGNETHLHGFKTALMSPDGSLHDGYLHTSPEFAM